MRIANINRARWILVLLTIWSTMSSLCVFPASLSYFNEFVGGPGYGHLHLLGSSLEWGQDLLELRRWINEHPSARPVYVWFDGMLDPRDLGIDCVDLNSIRTPVELRNGDFPKDGWYAIGVGTLVKYNMLASGAVHDVARSNGALSAISNRSPTVKVGFSIYLYNATAVPFNQSL